MIIIRIIIIIIILTITAVRKVIEITNATKLEKEIIIRR